MKSRSRTKPIEKLFACWLTLSMLVMTTPPVYAQGEVVQSPTIAANVPAFTGPEPKGGVKTGPTKLIVVSSAFKLSDTPTDLELQTCRAFQEPLVPLSGAAPTGDNAALARALKAFKAKKSLDVLSDLDEFVSTYPSSRWTPSVEASLGSLKFQTGYLTDALKYWNAAWEAAKDDTGSQQIALANGAFANLVNLNARLGRGDDLHKYFGEAGNRPFFGSDEYKVKGARDGLYFQEHDAKKAFKCGPYAVNSLWCLEKKQLARHPILDSAASTSNGTTLAQVNDWAKQVGLNYQMAKRSKGAPFLYPAVAHWTLNHFAAIVGMDNGRYHIQDPTFDTDAQVWVTPQALEAETDGYFLVPASTPLPAGWTTVSEEEGQKVFGKGTSTGRKAGPGNCSVGCCPGMARASVISPQATLKIDDMPLHYECPIADMGFSVSYNHLEAGQPSGAYTFTNLGANWSTNWVSYLTVDGSNNATVRLRTGGIEIYNPSGGVYSNNNFSHALLVNTGTNAYTRTLPDGTVETYNQADSSSPPLIFLTSVTDPQGRSTLVQYDANFRVTSVTDPMGQVSSFAYLSNTVGNVGFYKLATITDCFGRSCTFSYDSATTTRLISITDQIGLISKFAYDSSSSMITQMITPYGTTSFQSYVPGTDTYPPLACRTTYPDGTWDVVENWLNETKTTFHWDRHATQLYPNEPGNPGNTTTFPNYTHCEKTKYTVDISTGVEGTSPQRITHPLETNSPILFQYPGQTISPNFTGTSDAPTVTQRDLGNQVVDFTVGGTATAGDILTAGLVSNVSATYTVQAGDTPAKIAAGFAANVNASSSMRGQGVTAGAAGAIFSMHSDQPFKYQYFASFSGSGVVTETVGIRSHTKQTAIGTLTGTTLVAGDQLRYYVNTPWPNGGGQQVFLHTVVGGDTLTSIVADFASQSNANAILTKFGYQATASGAVLSLVSYNSEIQAYSFSNNSMGGNELLTFSNYINGATMFEGRQYNDYARVTQSVDSIGRTFSYAYAANKIDVLQQKETRGTDDFQMGAWTYNSYHMPLTATDGSGRVTTYTYNSLNQPLTVTDPDSKVTTMTYTGTCKATIGGTITAGDSVSIIVHDAGLSGGVKTITYTPVLSGDTTAMIATKLRNLINADASLIAIGVTATSSASVITMTSTSVNVTSYTSSTSGGATETVAIGANSFGYLTKINGPLAGNMDVTTIAYDGLGRISTVTNSENYTLTFTYDSMDRPVKTAYPDGSSEQTVWNKLDAVLIKDRNNRWTQRAFDSLRQLSFEIDPLCRKTQYTWCTCGSLTSLSDPAGHVTSWSHDLQGRVTQKIYQDSSTMSYVYESWSSRLLSTSDALTTPQVKTFFYNPDDTLYQTNYTNAANATAATSFLYDQNFSRVTSAQQNNWGTISYTYNPYILPLGTPTTGGGEIQLSHNDVMPNSDMTYVYDTVGRVTNRSINSTANSDTWSYDAMSRVTAESNILGSFGYAYVDDVSGSSRGTTRLASVTYPNSQVTNFSWYPPGQDERLQQIANRKTATGVTISQYGHVFDAVGQLTQWQQLQNNSSLSFNLGYDQASQLVSSQVASRGQSAAVLKQNYFAYDLASNRTGSQQNTVTRVNIGGTVTVGNTLTITVKDNGLGGGQQAINYTVVTGDDLTKIAAGLAANITTNANIQAIGVSASSNGSVLSIRSASPRITTYASSTSGGATETISLGVTGNFVENAVIGGTKTTGNTVTITVIDPALAGGKTDITYTVLAGDTLTTIATGLKNAINANAGLTTLGVSATSVGTAITIKSNSANATTYAQSTSSGATATVSLSVNQNGPQTVAISGTVTTGDVVTLTVYDSGLSGGKQAVSHTVVGGDTPTIIATDLTSKINADTNLQSMAISATSSGSLMTIQSSSVNATTLRSSTSTNATEIVQINIPANGIQTAAIGGTKTTGNTLTITVYDAALAGGSKAVAYVVLAGDTLTSIATNLAAAITADASLAAIGVSATSKSTVVNVLSTSKNNTTYSQSVSGGATETITLGRASSTSLFGYNNLNALTSIATGGPTAFQGATNKGIKSATVGGQAATLNWAENFSGNAALTNGSNDVTVTATDAVPSTTTNHYQVTVGGPGSSSLTYDKNGNMTSDGTNSYLWDAENRLIQITYPGSGNNSQFTYDPFGDLVKIVERTAGAITTTKQLLRNGENIFEERDASNSVVKRFFALGQTLSGANYYYTKDHLGSIRDLCDSSGSSQAHYEYDLWGQTAKTSGSLDSDFTFAGYYQHIPSTLNVTRTRFYNSSLARFISRDVLDEMHAGVNRYAYVSCCPTSFVDPSGMADCPTGALPHAAKSALMMAHRAFLSGATHGNETGGAFQWGEGTFLRGMSGRPVTSTWVGLPDVPWSTDWYQDHSHLDPPKGYPLDMTPPEDIMNACAGRKRLWVLGHNGDITMYDGEHCKGKCQVHVCVYDGKGDLKHDCNINCLEDRPQESGN